MAKLTQSKFLTECNDTLATIARPVIRQSGGWASFADHAADVANHGASAGFNGFIYNTDTVAFAKRNRLGLLAYAREMADDLGEPGAYSLIASFNCIGGMTSDDVADAVNNAKHDDYTQVMNALAWFALEEVSRRYVDIADGEG